MIACKGSSQTNQLYRILYYGHDSMQDVVQCRQNCKYSKAIVRNKNGTLKDQRIHLNAQQRRFGEVLLFPPYRATVVAPLQSCCSGAPVSGDRVRAGAYKWTYLVTLLKLIQSAFQLLQEQQRSRLLRHTVGHNNSAVGGPEGPRLSSTSTAFKRCTLHLQLSLSD